MRAHTYTHIHNCMQINTTKATRKQYKVEKMIAKDNL